jgi:hypothetical protein
MHIEFMHGEMLYWVYTTQRFSYASRASSAFAETNREWGNGVVRFRILCRHSELLHRFYMMFLVIIRHTNRNRDFTDIRAASGRPLSGSSLTLAYGKRKRDVWSDRQRPQNIRNNTIGSETSDIVWRQNERLWHLKISHENGYSQNHHSNISHLSYEEEQMHNRSGNFETLKDSQIQGRWKLTRGQKRTRVK